MLAKQHIFTKILTILVVSAALVVTLLGASSMAEEAATVTANTLKVSPVRTDVTVKPGETKTVKVTVTNPSDSEVMVRPIQNDFIAGDEDGTPALILEEDEYAPKHSLKRYLQPLENVRIPAKESKTVEVKIKVPANANAGGYFGAIRFAPVAPDDGGQVNMSPSVASLILMTVSGDVKEKLNLTEFEVQQNGKAGWLFTNSDKMSATVRFENSSDIQLAPFGKVSVTKGSEVVHSVDFNSNSQRRDMILPDSARRWEIPLDKIDGFGQYTVSAVFTYGSKNQTIEISKSFWVIPVAFWIAAAVVLLLIIAAIVGFIYSRRRASNGMSLGNRRR